MNKPLSGKRILVCGKGGCGKSSVVSLMAHVLQDETYKVIVLDGDASNPGGLARLMFGTSQGPTPLIHFFGGREKVECPVDNPAPLTRINDTIPITEKNMDLAEIPPEYFMEKENILLFQIGKIEEFREGCDGPMSKVTRDFIVKGQYVQLIDVEAGIEHFGRGVEQNVDLILVVVDPTFESLLIAEKISHFCSGIEKTRVWTILNKVQSKDMESIMLSELKKKKIETLGVVHFDDELMNAGLRGSQIGKSKAQDDMKKIMKKLSETK
jgi:CO dehydrogenase maturation factor